MTGRENCYLAGSLLGYSKNDIKQRMARIISFSRLAFTLATEVEPDVLILDEMFGVGDDFFTKKSIMRMIKLMNQGSTTLMVSHNIDFLVHQCKRLIWIDAGKIQMDGWGARNSCYCLSSIKNKMNQTCQVLLFFSPLFK